MSMHSYVLFLTSVVLGCGCSIRLGPLDNDAGNGPPQTSVLPRPNESRGDEPALDDAQQARQEEADRYVAEVVYKGATITQTLQLSSGDIVDGLDRATLPPILDSLPPLPEDLVLPPGVEFGLTELDQVPQLLDLVTTAAPFHRPTFWPYILGETDATSIGDYLDRYQVGGAPELPDRLYAGLGSKEPNRGVSGYINQFRPEVAPDSFSLIELAVACPAEGAAEEVVGAVISVDKANTFGKGYQPGADGQPRLHIEYARRKGSLIQYDWDGLDGSFVANPLRRHRPGEIVPFSTLGGKQVEHLISIFQVPLGDWWIAYQGELLGYYPASVFTMLNQGACRSTWYGEVYRLDPGAGSVKTEMGSGQFANANLLYAAYVRNLTYYDLLWFGAEPEYTNSMIPNVPSCYSRSPLVLGLPPWNNYFLLGGPGGRNRECQWPSP
jgi:hypothetical protein